MPFKKHTLVTMSSPITANQTIFCSVLKCDWRPYCEITKQHLSSNLKPAFRKLRNVLSMLFSTLYAICLNYAIMLQNSSLVTRLDILRGYLMSSFPEKIRNMILLCELVNHGNHIKGKCICKTKLLNMNYRVFSLSFFQRPWGSLRTSDGEGTDIKTPFNTASTQAEGLSALACTFSSRWISSSSSRNV